MRIYVSKRIVFNLSILCYVFKKGASQLIFSGCYKTNENDQTKMHQYFATEKKTIDFNRVFDGLKKGASNIHNQLIQRRVALTEIMQSFSAPQF